MKERGCWEVWGRRKRIEMDMDYGRKLRFGILQRLETRGVIFNYTTFEIASPNEIIKSNEYINDKSSQIEIKNDVDLV